MTVDLTAFIGVDTSPRFSRGQWVLNRRLWMGLANDVIKTAPGLKIPEPPTFFPIVFDTPARLI